MRRAGNSRSLRRPTGGPVERPLPQMLSRVIVVVALVLGSFSATPAAAQSLPGNPPIEIKQCRIQNSRGFVAPYRSMLLTFLNRNDVAADEVRFNVQYNGRTEHVTDRGIFSRGAMIVHQLEGLWNAPFAGSAPTSCAIEHVHFQDGSSWEAPLPTPTRKPAVGTAM